MIEARVHHAGFVVSDLDAAIAFFEQLGFEEGARMRSNSEMAATINGVPGADIELAFMEGCGTTVELMTHATGDGSPPPRPDGIGAGHLCLQCDDIEAAHRAALERDLTLVSPPQRGEFDIAVMFVEGPDGLRVEYVQFGASGGE